MLVEAIILDQSQRFLKTVAWNTFSMVNTKGRPMQHPADFYAFAESVVDTTFNLNKTFSGRVDELRLEFKKLRKKPQYVPDRPRQE